MTVSMTGFVDSSFSFGTIEDRTSAAASTSAGGRYLEEGVVITIGPTVVRSWIAVVLASMISSLVLVIIASVIALVTAVTAGLFSSASVVSLTAGAMVVFSISSVRTSSSIGLIISKIQISFVQQEQCFLQFS
jgi:hypothetical protein